ncbi:MAG: threonylcarbamoyl-AMP synthase [Bacteroidetes bacterium 4572_77]|nr:MAG: threonylcarbamoyl-AMP synthase [Bacteroidetes bacterium 4572_77]
MLVDIQESLKVLRKDGTILYPTDTVWGLGCDATKSKAVNNIYKIKNRKEKKSLIILVSSIEEIPNYVEHFPKQISDLIQNYPKPLTIVFPGAKNISKNLIPADGTIAIRVVKNAFCIQLIQELGNPLVSTSANISGSTTPIIYREIAKEIKSKVDYIVKHQQKKLSPASPSSIIKVDHLGNYEMLRS